MTNPIKGIIVPTGEHDTGKTVFAIGGSNVKYTAVINDDVKEMSFTDFGAFYPLRQLTRNMQEMKFHEYCVRLINDLKGMSGLEAIVWDNWTRFQDTIHPWTIQNPGFFREYQPRRISGEFAAAREWNDSFTLESYFLESLLEAAPLVILTVHVKKDRDKVRLVPATKKTLNQYASMRVWLKHSSRYAAPVGLIQKRLEKSQPDENGILQTVMVTPRRIEPFTWRTLWDYWENPVGDRPLRPDEVPNDYELSILNGTFTKDQIEMVKLMRGSGSSESVVDITEEVAEEAPFDVNRAREMKSSGMKPVDIANEMGVAIPILMKWINK